MENITYDKHGYMKTMQRYGLTAASTYGIIDNLTMAYNGNQMKTVTDAVADIALNASMDFKDYTKGTGTEYTYNANGAMNKDLNRGISQIQYNSLNLPLPRIVDIKNKSVEGRNEYTYSASGAKLKAVQKWNPNYSTSPVIGSTINTAALTMSSTTDYAGNIIYENNALKRILVDGGYYESGNYYFYITDHLGNNRIVANAAASVVQSTQYYPFGTPFADASGVSAQPYKYNGKELDSRNGLNMSDYSTRWKYDWNFPTVDPLAEKYYSWSPYAYVMNNPLKYIDPDGKDIIISGAQNQQALKELQGAAGSSITLSFGDNGTVNYNLNTNEPLSGHAATIVDIINDNSVAINLATNEGPVSSLLPGALLGGGLFMGNTFSTDKNENTIVSGTQEIDPSFLNALDSFWGTPGQTTMHELTEGYSAAKTTQVTGVTASPKLPEQPNDAYDKADNAAVPQNPISIVFLDKNGKPTSVQNAYTVAWFTNNGSDTKVLQTIFLEDEK